MNTDILFKQRLLRAQGFYPGPLDGKDGPQTQAAEQAFLDRTNEYAEQLGVRDDRSEPLIRQLDYRMQISARNFLKLPFFDTPSSFSIRIISGLRTYAEQDALYAKGRTASGPRVTRARAGESAHNFGLAFDCGIFEGEKYLEESPLYAEVAATALASLPDLIWGGNWTGIVDQPHYQLDFDLSIQELRRRFEAGEAYQ